MIQKRDFLSLLFAGAVIAITLSATLPGYQAVPARRVPRQAAVVPQSDAWLSIFPVSQHVFQLVGDARDPNILFAGTHRGLYRSSTAGERWSRIVPVNSATNMILTQSRSAPTLMYLGVTLHPPENINGFRGDLLKSEDEGLTWRQVGARDIQGVIRSVQIDPQNPDIVYVLANTLYKSMNGGRTWGNITPATGTSTSSPMFLVADPIRPGHLVAGYVTSEDGGTTWQPESRAVPLSYLQGHQWVTVNASAWKFVSFNPSDGTLRAGIMGDAGEYARLVISRDAGKSWGDISIPNERPPHEWYAAINAFAWSLQSPETIFASTTSSLYRSKEYGQKWNRILPQPASDVLASASGDIYAATPIGLLKSRNEGRNWHTAGLGLPIQTNCVLEAVKGQGIYVSDHNGYWVTGESSLTSEWHPFLGMGPNQQTNYGTLQQIVVFDDNTLLFNLSEDLCHPCNQIIGVKADGTRFSVKSSRTIQLIGASRANSRVIYATDGTTLMKSDDTGFSWETYDIRKSLRAGLAGWGVSGIPSIVVSPQAPQTVYALIRLHDLNPKNLVDPRNDLALVATSDGGATWRDIFPSQLATRLRLFTDLAWPSAGIAVDPRDSRSVYLFFNGGIFKSTDAGVKWSPVPIHAGKIADLAVSPSRILYVASDSGVWTSKDAGTSWALLNRGLDQDAMRKVATDGSVVIAQGANGIYRLSSDEGWFSARWRELEEKPESNPIVVKPTCVTCEIDQPTPNESKSSIPVSNPNTKSPDERWTTPRATEICSDVESCLAHSVIALQAADLAAATQYWDRVLALGGPVAIPVCYQRGMKRCERGTISLSSKEVSFTTSDGQKVLSVLPSQMTPKFSARDVEITHGSFNLQVEKKNNNYAFIPVGITCEMLNYLVCPPEGLTQQSAIANYAVHTILRLAVNQPGK
ncbi:MAG TPA: hypothetical protein VEU96_18350 [Bryobacteraceae bacterium]|nr:hypothetical protein [Bryobacteraceae bacterium]